ncbi:porin, partial [Sutterella massiliensis]
IKGYSLMAGVDAPMFGGTGMFAVGYADTEDAEVDKGAVKAESTRWGASAGYTYPLSKRTNVYGVVGYYQDKIENEEGKKGEDRDPSKAVVFLGMRHRF